MKNFFKKLLDLWIEFGKLLNKIVSPIALSLIYFAIFGFSFLVSKIKGADLLNRNASGESYWVNVAEHKEALSVDDYTRQF